MKYHELNEQRGKLIADARALYETAKAEGRSLTSDEQANFDKLHDEATKLKEQAETEQRKELLEHQETELRQSAGRKVTSRGVVTNLTEAGRQRAIKLWAMAPALIANGQLRSDDELFCEEYGINVRSGTFSRSLATSAAATGGNAVAPLFVSQIQQKLAHHIDVRQVANLLTTDTGADMPWPQIEDSYDASVVSQGGSVSTSNDPAFGNPNKILKAWRYESGIVKVSIEMLQDVPNIEQVLTDLLVKRIARKQETDFVLGSAPTTGPEGCLYGASTAVNLSSGNSLTFDHLISLKFAVNKAYRKDAAWMMSDGTLAAIRKLKDTTNNYLWQPSTQVGEPDLILGHPVYISNVMPDHSAIAADTGEKFVLFGSFKDSFTVRDVSSSFVPYRLDELYRSTGEVGFGVNIRSDARYVNSFGTVKALAGYDAP